MSTLDDVRSLRGTALRLLPGVCQARAQLDLAIGVLEYFARDAEHELTTGQFVKPRPMDREVASQIRILQSMLNTYMGLHQPPD